MSQVNGQAMLRCQAFTLWSSGDVLVVMCDCLQHIHQHLQPASSSHLDGMAGLWWRELYLQEFILAHTLSQAAGMRGASQLAGL